MSARLTMYDVCVVGIAAVAWLFCRHKGSRASEIVLDRYGVVVFKCEACERVVMRKVRA